MSLKEFLENNNTKSNTKQYATFPADGDTWVDVKVIQCMAIEKPSVKDPSKMDLAVVFVLEGVGSMPDGTAAPARFRTNPMTLCAGSADKPSNLSKFAKDIGYEDDCVRMVLEALEPETAQASFLFSAPLKIRFDQVTGSKGGRFTVMDKIKPSDNDYEPVGYDEAYAPTNVEKKVIIQKGGRADANVKNRAWVTTENLVATKEY